MRILATVVAVIAIASVAAAPNGCNVTDSFNDNKTINLAYFSAYGNVTFELNSVPVVVGVSFCAASNFSRGGANCGPAYLFIPTGSSCAESLVFDTLNSPLAVVDNKTSVVVYSTADGKSTASVVLVCQPLLDGVNPLGPIEVVNSAYTIKFSSEMACAGYEPVTSKSNELSKGAIVGIIIGVVAIVVIAAAVFQWRSKNRAEDYQQI